MTTEQRFLIDVVKSQLKGNKISEIPQGLNYSALYNLAIDQKLNVMLYYGIVHLGDKLDKSFLEQLQRSANRYVTRYIRSSVDVENLFNLLEENKINFLPLKGYWLKNYYPKEEMRFTHDYDILIDFKCCNVKKLLLQNGYALHAEDPHHDVYYSPQTKTIFELHKTVFEGNLNQTFGDGFKYAVSHKGSKYFKEFKLEDLYLSILAHSAAHFVEDAGFGIRTVIDCYFLKNKRSEMDEKYLNNRLTQCGILKFCTQLENLADLWFEDDIKQMDSFTELFSNHILASATLSNSANFGANKLAQATAKGEANNKKRAVLRKIFLPKADMYRNYPWLRKAKFLLPIGHIVRWFKIIFTRPKNISQIKQINNADANDAQNILKLKEGLNLENFTI